MTVASLSAFAQQTIENVKYNEKGENIFFFQNSDFQ